jgi:TPP-dependent pyruvate/acetoin dehydrogenase alpha subunit
MAGRDDDAERLVIDWLGDQTGFEKGSAMTMTSSSPAFSAGIRLP